MKLAGIKNKYWDRQAYANCRLRSDAVEKEAMKLVRGTGNMEIRKTLFRTIRCVTSEDSDHLPMQGQSDFAICGNKQACKLQFFETLQIFG